MVKKQKGGFLQWILMKKLMQGGGRINKRKRKRIKKITVKKYKKRKLNQKGGYMRVHSQDDYKKASNNCSIM